MQELLGPVLVLAAVLTVYYVLLVAPFGRVTLFNPARAALRSSSWTSASALLILAGLNLAGLTYDVIRRGEELQVDSATASAGITVFVIAAVTLLVLERSVADAMVGGVGVAAVVIGTWMQDGPEGVLALLVLTMLTLFLLGLARGFLRPFSRDR